MKKYFFSFLIILLTSSIFVKPVFADTLSLGIAPTVFQINTKAPADIAAPFVLANLSDETVTLHMSFQPFAPSDAQDGTIQPLGGNRMSGANPFIFEDMQVLDNQQVVTSITLGPKQKKNLILHIVLPVNETPSDYYFSLLFVSDVSNATKNPNSVLIGGIAANVLLSVGPTDKTKGAITDFSTSFFKQAGPVAFNLEVANQSSHFIVPRGNIVVENMFGQTIANIALQPVNILQHSSRFIPDDSSGNTTQAIWPEKVLLGFYKAKLTVALSSDGPLFSRTIYFFALPWQVLVGTFFAILLLLIIIERVHLRMKRKK